MSNCIVFTGGGTGGHIYPGIAIIKSLEKVYDGRIVWIGSGLPQEQKAVLGAGIEFLTVPSGKLRRSFSLKNFTDVFRVVAGFLKARRLLKKLKPQLVFSKGGYVSVAPVYAAHSLKIPVFTHESDLSPGLATRLNARVAEKILFGWEASLSRLPSTWASKAIATGNPVREIFGMADPDKGREFLGIDGSLPIIIVLGGSQGARQINELVCQILPMLEERAVIVHQTGPGNEACQPDGPYYRAFPYINDELPYIMAAAGIVIGRAGAGTISESIESELAMLLIPLTGETRGDQLENAELLSRDGACFYLTGEDSSAQKLLEHLSILLEDGKLRKEMAEKAKTFIKTGAAGKIAGIILERIKNGA